MQNLKNKAWASHHINIAYLFQFPGRSFSYGYRESRTWNFREFEFEVLG